MCCLSAHQPRPHLREPNEYASSGVSESRARESFSSLFSVSIIARGFEDSVVVFFQRLALKPPENEGEVEKRKPCMFYCRRHGVLGKEYPNYILHFYLVLLYGFL